jgi:hypothetical protein
MHGRETPEAIGMSVCVLTMGFWPTYPTVSAILPSEVNITCCSIHMHVNECFIVSFV